MVSSLARIVARTISLPSRSMISAIVLLFVRIISSGVIMLIPAGVARQFQDFLNNLVSVFDKFLVAAKSRQEMIQNVDAYSFLSRVVFPEIHLLLGFTSKHLDDVASRGNQSLTFV